MRRSFAPNTKAVALGCAVHGANDAMMLLRVTPPSRSPAFIPRDSLDRVFNGARWTALIAPSGYGKTQQALHWYHLMVKAGALALWVSCDRDMDWPTVLEAISLACGKKRIKNGSADARDVVRRLADDGRDIALFLDNCDGPVTENRGQDLQNLLRMLPPSARLVTTGYRPVTADARLLANDLRLDDVDALALFRELAPAADLDVSVAAAIRDGWAPAINIAVGAISSGQNTDEALFGPDGLLARYWLPYFSERRIRLVLGSLTILERYDENLIAILSGCSDADDRVEEYLRCTPFFKDGALSELARLHFALPAEDQQRLHNMAADWLIARGRILDAVPHLIATENLTAACEILDGTLMSQIMDGDLQKVLQWLEAIGPDQIAEHPSLSLAAALAFATSGDRAQADRYLRYHSTDDRYVLEMLLATHTDDPDKIVQMRRLIRAPEQLSPMSRAMLKNCDNLVLQKQGRWPAENGSAAVLRRPDGDSLRMFQAYSYSLVRQAFWYMQQGQARRANKQLVAALDHSDRAFGRISTPSTLLATTFAGAMMQQGDVSCARQMFADRAFTVKSHTVPGVWSMGAIVKVRIAALRGDQEEALAWLNQVEERAVEKNTPAIEALALAERAGLEISMGHSPRSGDREQLVRLYAAAVSVPVNGLHIRIEALKGLARIAIANRDERTAQNLLREGRRLAIKVNRRLDGLEFALLLGEDGQAPEFQQIDIADASELRRRSRIDPIRSPGTVMQNVSVQSGLMLTVREREILALLEQHHSNKAVARKLELGLETVKWHVANLLSKVGASDRNHAIERARALGLLRFQFSNTPL